LFLQKAFTPPLPASHGTFAKTENTGAARVSRVVSALAGVAGWEGSVSLSSGDGDIVAAAAMALLAIRAFVIEARGPSEPAREMDRRETP
jgi:hypothetical protein